MADEQKIQEQLIAKFPELKDKVRLPRARRIYAEVPAESFSRIFDYAVKELGFTMLPAITGLDLGADLGLLYHLARPSGEVLNLSLSVPKERPVVRTVTSYFPTADVYEREVVDLFGFQVEGLPPGSRYPLPDSWPAGQYPLRKDWKAESLQIARPQDDKGVPHA